jgi:predicted Zn-dependent peptidase
VLSSATADDLEAMPDGGIVVRFTLENRTGGDVAGATLRATLPAETAVADSWEGEPGRGTGTVSGGAIAWEGVSLADGAASAAFAARLVPASGANGASLFRFATIQAEVRWPGADPSAVVAPPLKLNGLWGEEGLRRTMLPTGLTVFTREMSGSQTVAIRVGVRAGSRDETEVTRGGSHWLEHAFFLGTPKRPGNEEIFNAIRNVGGAMNATTGHEQTDYYNTVPAEYFDLALDVVADQLLNSNFPRDRFDRERRVVAEELRISADSPVSVAWDLFYNQIFVVSPLRQDPGGTIESVSNIPIETILAYRAERYRTGNMAVAVAGRLQHDEAVARIAAVFAPLARGPRAERPRTPEPAQTMPRRQEVGRGTRVAEIRMGWPVAGDDDERDSPALVILEAILGDVGLRLQAAFGRNNVPASVVAPFYDVFSDAGVFGVAGRAEANGGDAFVAAVQTEIGRVRRGQIGEAEVQEAIRALIGRRALGGQTSLGQTGVADIEVTGQLDSFLEYASRYSAVTVADVQRAAQTYLDPQNFTLVVVRP